LNTVCADEKTLEAEIRAAVKVSDKGFLPDVFRDEGRMGAENKINIS
jgi:hypothetical protein